MPDDTEKTAASPLIQSPGSIFPRREPNDLEIWTITVQFLRMVRARVEEITGDANNLGYEDIIVCAKKCLIEYEQKRLAEAEWQLEEDERRMSAISSSNVEHDQPACEVEFSRMLSENRAANMG